MLGPADAHLLRILDDGFQEARRRAGSAATCRSGCFGCCLGPFPITMADAARLRLGLNAADPMRASRIRDRAAEAMLALRDRFPGDWSTGLLDEPRAAVELYAPRYQMVPCPALQLETGACELYEYRPAACRTFGLALRIDRVDLVPCRLNYTGLAPAEVEALRVDIRLGSIDLPGVESGQTVAAAALR